VPSATCADAEARIEVRSDPLSAQGGSSNPGTASGGAPPHRRRVTAPSVGCESATCTHGRLLLADTRLRQWHSRAVYTRVGSIQPRITYA
jgi:hypothetical protein